MLGVRVILVSREDSLCYRDRRAVVTQMSKRVSLCCFAALSFPDKMSPIKALTMKDYENVSDINLDDVS